jgi:hypothetical protein
VECCVSVARFPLQPGTHSHCFLPWGLPLSLPPLSILMDAGIKGSALLYTLSLSVFIFLLSLFPSFLSSVSSSLSSTISSYLPQGQRLGLVSV